MLEHDRYGVPRVPPSELAKFANTLYSFLYYHLDLQKTFVRTSDYFQDIMGTTVFCIERTTYKFNTVVIDGTSYLLSSLTICQKMCSSFSDNNYFKKLYYLSAYILDYILWQYETRERLELALGPYLWKKMFRSNFESRFELNGGWQAFADSGETTIEFFQTELEYGNDLFLPDSYVAMMFGHINLIPIPPITPEELSFSLENLSLEHIPSEESDDSDDDDSAPSGGDGNVRIEEPSASTSKKSSKKRRRKRKRDPTTQDSEQEGTTVKVGKEQHPLPGTSETGELQIVEQLESTPEEPGKSTPEKPGRSTPEKAEKSTDKSGQKRRHEGSTAKDSDNELDSPSSSKAKMDGK